MALSNIGREPRREITEQLFGLVFVLAYAGWIAVSVHLSTEIYTPTRCLKWDDHLNCIKSVEAGYWHDPGPLFITIAISLSIWLLYPFLLLMHAAGEMVCEWMAAIGLDPRPRDRR